MVVTVEGVLAKRGGAYPTTLRLHPHNAFGHSTLQPLSALVVCVSLQETLGRQGFVPLLHRGMWGWGGFVRAGTTFAKECSCCCQHSCRNNFTSMHSLEHNIRTYTPSRNARETYHFPEMQGREGGRGAATQRAPSPTNAAAVTYADRQRMQHSPPLLSRAACICVCAGGHWRALSRTHLTACRPFLPFHIILLSAHHYC